ncbi:uncharacterized protein LOC112511071 isoform X2 [Cynara cardunculus var. scolymus]|uniref:uncharacterized protein LOC112511071 isoform X2 n=1 Tax=Cynara cardunculus var. scolymus TaxID=59895 RepID=UPI000D62D1F4|nr:uncharacterized protein LOC112511071 isoform X2 [Cynara cardunculus var. scolymus]
MIKMMIKTMKIGFLFLLLTSSVVVAGAMWSSSPRHHHRHQVAVKEPHRVVVIEFRERRQGNTKVLISQHDDSGAAVGGGDRGRRPVVEDGGFTTGLKTVVSGKANELKEHAKEAMDEAVEKVGDPTGKLSEKLSDGVKSVGETVKNVAGNELSETLSHGVTSVGEKSKEVAGHAKEAVGEALGSRIGGALKDSVVKLEDWDVIDSPKRIGEDIERNVSQKIEQGTEELKETSLNELLRGSKNLFFLMFPLEKIKAVISWCHLLGFSTAYGMGVWFTFVSSCVLGKCLPKREFGMVVNKMYRVYFRAMAYCVGGGLIGYLVSQGRKGIAVWNKMEMFQGFNLLSALFMILINLIFLEPRATKLMVERNKIKEKDRKRVREKEEMLKKLNIYSSTLNVSTLVVLTWHMAYIGQLLHARYD